jgi:agmatine/peptidylarginine deiminase
MFATFTAPDCVVVGQYDPRDDQENAAILERNARRLASIRLPRQRLHVRRIPMPSNTDGVWRTYTNVIYANDVLLVPVYSETNMTLQQQAVGTYRSLLPKWNIKTINADDLIVSGGALHCAVMNLGPLPLNRMQVDHRAPPISRIAQRRYGVFYSGRPSGGS